MDYWAAIANLLNKQATRTISGTGAVEKLVAVTDSSASGLPGSAMASVGATVTSDFGRSEGGGSRLLPEEGGCGEGAGVGRRGMSIGSAREAAWRYLTFCA